MEKPALKSSQRPNFKGDGELPEGLASPKRRNHSEEEEVHDGSFVEWLLSIAPIFLAGLSLGFFLVYMFSPASIVEVMEEGAEMV